LLLFGQQESGAMYHAKSGCIFGLAVVAMALLGVLLWPYRSESIESAVSANQTGGAISSTSNGGWREDVAAQAIGTSRVANLLSIIEFVDVAAACWTANSIRLPPIRLPPLRPPLQER